MIFSVMAFMFLIFGINSIAQDKTIGTITYFAGKGSVLRSGNGANEVIDLDMLIYNDDVITTEEESKAEITITETGTIITIFENSKMSLSDILNASEQKTTFINMVFGKIKMAVAKLAGQEEFIVNTPTGVASVRGTEFEVAISDVGDSLISVKEGSVEVIAEDEKSSIMATQGKNIVVELDALPQDYTGEETVDEWLKNQNSMFTKIGLIKLKKLFVRLSIFGKNLSLIEKNLNEIYNNKTFQNILEKKKKGKTITPKEEGYWSAFRKRLLSLNTITYKMLNKMVITVDLISRIAQKLSLDDEEIRKIYNEGKKFKIGVDRVLKKLYILNQILAY